MYNFQEPTKTAWDEECEARGLTPDLKPSWDAHQDICSGCSLCDPDLAPQL